MVDVKISELPVAGSAAGTDQLEANQAGTSRSITVAQIGTSLGVTAGAPYLPLTGGTLTGPGNLAVGGTLGVTGITTLSAALTSKDHTIFGPGGVNGGIVQHNDTNMIVRSNNAGSVLLLGSSATNWMQISAVGNLLPQTTNTNSLGTSGNRWSNVYGVLGDFTGALTGTSATFSSTVGISGNTTFTGSSASGGHVLYNDTNTGGQVWQTGPGAGSASPDEWTLYNQGTTTSVMRVGKTGIITLPISPTFPDNTTKVATTAYVTTALATTSGHQIQMVSTQTGAVATGTTQIPADDTIPQITEGDQYMTLAITPKSATSKLVIDVVGNFSNSVQPASFTMALFQDATANALAAVGITIATAAMMGPLKLTHTMTSGTTSATTFRVRAGGNVAATATFNGIASGRIYGGVMASSIVIREVA